MSALCVELVTVSLAFAVYGVPLEAVAVMVQLPAVAGAVKSPVLSMEPQEAAQVTAILAENCCVLFTAVVAPDGVMEIGEDTLTFVEAVWPLPSLAVPVTLHAG